MPATDAQPHPTPPSCCRESKEQALGASFRSESSDEAADEEEHGYAISEGPPTPLTEGQSGPSTEERARRTWKQKRRASLRHVTPRRRRDARPLLHPDVKKMVEGFFRHVKSTDPDQQIREALSQVSSCACASGLLNSCRPKLA